MDATTRAPNNEGHGGHKNGSDATIARKEQDGDKNRTGNFSALS